MNILLIHVHSGLNLGDDGIMQATINGLRSRYPEAQLTVAANDPDSWDHYGNLTVVPALCSWVADCRLGRWKEGWLRMGTVLLWLTLATLAYRWLGLRWLPRAPERRPLLRAYYSADLILSCGGGNLYAHRALSPSFIWALITMGLGLALGKPVAMLPQSIGPIEGHLQRWLAGRVINRVQRLIVREPESAAFVRSNFSPRSEITLSPDLAFGLPPLHQGSDANDPPRLGLVPIDRGAQGAGFQRQANYESILANTALEFQSQTGAEIHLFVQCYGPSQDQDDRHIARRMYHELRRQSDGITLHDHFTTAEDVRRAYAGLDVMIATRMHAAIFALSAGVPIIHIGYQPKSRGLMDRLGMSAYYVAIEEIDSSILNQQLAELMVNHKQIKVQIGGLMRRQEHEAAHWLDIIGSLT